MSDNRIEKYEVQPSTNPITLTRFLLQEKTRFKQATGDFAMLLQSIQLACKVIARAAASAGIADLYGVAGEENATGDVQKKLDVYANDAFINCLTFSDLVYIMGSEEVEKPIILDSKAGGYAVVFDPLDGSSNIDANVSVGTIWGIYKKDPESDRPTSVEDLLRPGNQLLCGGYAMYGASTIIVMTTGYGVNGFMLDPTIGEFILTHPNMRMPKKGNIYSINEGNQNSWDEVTLELVTKWKTAKKPLKARYIGSMVADIHRTLLYGGIFCYPTDRKGKGKLRLVYECNPIAMIIEQAGGKATTGTRRVLDIKPNSLHERVAIWAGSADLVDQVEECYKAHAREAKDKSPQIPSKL